MRRARPAAPDRLGLLQMLGRSAPIVLLIMLVLGGIYGGVFTPTEAGGVGAMGAFILALAKRALTWQKLWDTLLETGHVTASISFLLIGAHLYANMIALSGLPDALGNWMAASGYGFYTLLAVYLLLILVLGTILDSASIMLIVIPLVLPIMQQFDVDLVWFGILTVITVEVGLLTPPLGVACFVIRSNLQDARITLNDIFIGAAPFALTMLLLILAIICFPVIVTVFL